MSLDGTVTDLDNEIKLKQLYNTRKHLKASLTRFNTFLSSFSDDKLLQLKKRIEDIEVVYKKFNETQLAIELINEDEENSDERDIFENRYYDILQSALDTVERISLQNQPPASAHSVIQGTNLNQNALDYQPNKFPTIELIKFYGEYDKWPQFRDLYISMIHDDPKIQKVRKFYYLVGSLRGQAEKILSGIPITNENYDVAWNLLKDRFENVALTLKNHVKALFNLPNVSDKYSLRNLKDDFQFRFRAIEALGEPVDSWDTLLIHILTSKLDTSTEERWDEKLISNKIGKPTLENLLDFLADRCSILETKTTQSLNSEKASKNYNAYKTGSKNIPGRSKTQNFSVNEIKCVMCNNSHYIYRCQKFKELAVVGRWVEAKRLKLCTNCLRTNHQSPDCTAQGCKVCSKQHNTLLHIDGHNTGENQSVACSSRVHLNKPNEILLSTAIILIKGRDGTWHRCRVLLDSGAQANFITSDLLHKLNLAPTHVKMQSVGVGGAAISISNQIKTEISSVSKTFSATLAFFVLKRITPRIPNCTFTQKLLNLPANLELADAEFNVSSEIDLLIGAELFYDLLECEQIKLGNTSPILQKTKLGWIISGPLYTDMEAPVACNLSVTGKLDEAIERFWKIEEVPQPKMLSHEEQTGEDHFINTTERDDTGRFIVRLPISELNINFGNSVKNAIKRLHSVEHRFVRNISFKQEYVKFMSEYEALGHMTKLEYETNTANENVYYLPHHGVLNESSSTTKLRVVFDGSCKSSNNVSLNEKLLIGPTIQDDLFSILSRFRLHNYVMTADVEKMYRQVLIAPDQRNLQRIVWRDDEDKQINHYALNTITYGTASASFLAIRCLQQAGIENKAEYPNASKVILKDFYVDDLITGAATIAEAQVLASNITIVLSKYGFNSRKWVVNDSQIMNCNASADQEYYITDNSVKKALGVYWNSKTDIFKFVINEQNIKPNIVTKRTLLSAISKIFDPLGLIAPVTIRAKILMQILWQAKLGWDELPSSNIVNLWEQFSDQLIELNNVNIPRLVLLEKFEFIEFHVFSDASLRAYGAAVYIKTYLNDQSNVSLLCSKTRVAPIKTITLPRLELCGALLGLQLYLKLRESLSINTSRVYFWTDSSIVLSWLRLPANTLKIFVSNRVSMIQQNTSIDQWRYVPSLENPADIFIKGY